MKSQSELLKAIIDAARKRNYVIRETQKAFDFYKDGVLIDRFYKFSVDYPMSEAEYKLRIETIERF